jgi:hypothetical protein
MALSIVVQDIPIPGIAGGSSALPGALENHQGFFWANHQ